MKSSIGSAEETKQQQQLSLSLWVDSMRLCPKLAFFSLQLSPSFLLPPAVFWRSQVGRRCNSLCSKNTHTHSHHPTRYCRGCCDRQTMTKLSVHERQHWIHRLSTGAYPSMLMPEDILESQIVATHTHTKTSTPWNLLRPRIKHLGRVKYFSTSIIIATIPQMNFNVLNML